MRKVKTGDPDRHLTWPPTSDSRQKLRNAGPIFATSHDTKTFVVKYARSRRAVDVDGKTVSQAHAIRSARACRIKGNGHDRCPGYRTCHCCDGNTGNNDGSGAWLKAGTTLVRRRNCPCRNSLDGAFHDDRCVRDAAIVHPCVTVTRSLGSSFSI